MISNLMMYMSASIVDSMHLSNADVYNKGFSREPFIVALAQLAEHLDVAQAVTSSMLVGHPNLDR